MTDSPMRRARFIALEALYEADSSDHDAEAVYERLLREAAQEDETIGKPGPSGFGRGAVRGVLRRRDEIDAHIQEAASLYPLHTMAVVDRNILRLAIWELLTDDASPVGAVVNEAVELAHRYSGESSPGFINGVLRTITQRLRDDPSAARTPAGNPRTQQEN